MTTEELATEERTDPSWLRLALKELGQREIKGPSANPRIVAYHQTTRLASKSDETPWCASFLSWIMVEAGYNSTRSAAASSWAEYGVACSVRRGAVAVFKRTGGHHVGIVVGIGNGFVWLLGGNQGDAVTIAKYSTAKLIAYRCPEPAKARVVDASWFAGLQGIAKVY
jgi:uncharacterized protein (TIGR02594 family)